jgi:hypothetical protein
MKHNSLTKACLIAAIAICAALAAAEPIAASAATTSAPAAEIGTSAYVSPLLQRETEALTRQGISPARASQAIVVQGEIARTEILTKIEDALAGAFAGAWFEPTTAQLHVGVTSLASEQKAEEVVARAGLTGNVVATPVHSTWKQLLATESQWNSKLANAFARGGVTLALSPQLNAVSVTLSSATPAGERAALEREASASKVRVNVFVVPSSQLEFTPERQGICKAFTKANAFCEKPLASGVRVDNTAVNGFVKACTIGPMAIPKNNRNATYALTAGHCLKNVGEPYFAYTPAVVRGMIGLSVSTTYGLNGDYGAINIERPGFWSNAGATPVFALTAEWKLTGGSTVSYPVKGERTPVVGFTNCHEGGTTGQSCGQIKALQVKAKYKDGTVLNGMVEDKGANGEGGDSGGPWLFIESNNEVLMEGVHSGGTSGTKVTLFYTPLTTILNNLNLNLLTTANETRGTLGATNGVSTEGKAKVGPSTFTDISANVECERAVGEWKLPKAKESTTVNLHINALHGKPAGWEGCKAGALGTVEEFSACELQEEADGEGLGLGSILKGCTILVKAITGTCEVKIPGEASNDGLEEILNADKSPEENFLAKVNIKGITSEAVQTGSTCEFGGVKSLKNKEGHEKAEGTLEGVKEEK